MNAARANVDRSKPGVFVRAGMQALAVMVLASCAQLEPSPGPKDGSDAPPPNASPSSAPPSGPAPPAAPVRPPTRPAAGAAEISTGWQQRGQISHYGKAFAGKQTASGDTFDPELLTMAHRTLPFGTVVRVTNVENQQSVEVVVNDRGPFVAGRIADLSSAAARRIGMVVDGVVEAVLEVIQPSKAR